MNTREEIEKERRETIKKYKECKPKNVSKKIFRGNKKEGVLYTKIYKRNGEILHFNGEPSRKRR